MYSSPTKIQSEPKLLVTQIALKQPRTVNGYCYHFSVPDSLLPEYRNTIYTHGTFYKEACDLFHELYPQAPYSAGHFVKFLKDCWGISTTVCYFTNPTELDVKGTWEWDNDQRDSVTIRIESTMTDAQKKLTIIHECFHVIQDIDPSFLAMVEGCHPDIRLRVVERIAEKSAVEAVLPRHEYDRCKREKQTNLQIADRYRVSMRLVSNFRV